MAVKATVLAARSVLEGLLLLRDPRRRRGVSGALPSSASGRPYRRWEAEAGSTSNSVIAIPSNNVIVLTCIRSVGVLWGISIAVSALGKAAQFLHHELA
jgi:hypothetical protein